MTIFKPAFENTTEILADVNAHFDNRQSNKLTLDSTSLIRAFREKVECIGGIFLPCSLLDVKRIQAKANQIHLKDALKRSLN